MVEEYTYRCVQSPTCDASEDTHGRECERVNDEARAEFYLALASEGVVSAVEELGRAMLRRHHPTIAEELGI